MIETYKKLFQRFYFAVFREIVVNFSFSRVKAFRKQVHSLKVLFVAPFSCLEPCFFQQESNVCLFCTKFCSNNKKVNLAITKTLKIRYFQSFPTLLYCDVLPSDEINLSV